MTCHIVQPQQGKNAGERDMFSFLKNMPEDYTLYSELKINVGYKDQVEHLEQKQPDFVVVGNDIGIVSIEVKDWNLLNNIYEWKNQFALNKYDARTGKLITGWPYEAGIPPGHVGIVVQLTGFFGGHNYLDVRE